MVNKFGIKWSCMIAAVSMPLAGSSYYVSAKYGIDWYLLFSKVRITQLAFWKSCRPNKFIAGLGVCFGLSLRRGDDGDAIIPQTRR